MQIHKHFFEDMFFLISWLFYCNEKNTWDYDIYAELKNPKHSS